MATICAFATAGCGDGDDGDDRQQMEGALSDVSEAIRARDLDAVCSALGVQARRQVTRIGHGEALDCSDGLRQIRPLLEEMGEDAPTIERVVTKSALVTVRVKGRAVRVPFVKEGADWKVDSFYGIEPKRSEEFD